MAQHESDREDLMREAKALFRRAELICPGEAETVIAGFRRDGRLSIYFGPDPVFQFDEQRRLRRAYASGFLYRTQGETLARLTRHRTPNQTELLRHDLDSEELAAFHRSALEKLSQLHEVLLRKEIQIIAHIPAEDDLLPELQEALEDILRQDLPLAPALPGKR